MKRIAGSLFLAGISLISSTARADDGTLALSVATSFAAGEVELSVTQHPREKGREVARLALSLDPGKGARSVFKLKVVAQDGTTAVAAAALAGVDLVAGADPAALEGDLRGAGLTVTVDVVRSDPGDIANPTRTSVDLVNLLLTGSSLTASPNNAVIAAIRDGADALGRGGTCAVAGCPGACSEHGVCIAGRCFCSPGFVGADCGTLIACPNDCSQQGICLFGACFCEPGFGGKDCSVINVCPAGCNKHGICSRGTCFCDPGFSGKDCSEVVGCPGDCSGNGECAHGKCFCSVGWTGVDCGTPVR